MGSGNSMNGREQKFTQGFHFNIILPLMPRSFKCYLSVRFPHSCSNFNIHFNIILPSMPRSSKCSLFAAPVLMLIFILILSSHLCLCLSSVHFLSAPVVILIFILISSSHLCLSLPSVFFPSAFLTMLSVQLSSPPVIFTCPALSFILI